MEAVMPSGAPEAVAVSDLDRGLAVAILMAGVRRASHMRVGVAVCLVTILVAVTAIVSPAGAAAAAPDGLTTSVPRLRTALDGLVAAGAPGAVVLVRDGNRTVRLARGFADRARKAPMRVTDRFRVGSVTKTFVATVVLQLAGEGRLSLDDTVERWLPGLVPNGQGITIRQLLNHTSGLFDYTQDPAILRPYVHGHLTVVRAPRTLVARATAHPPLFAPGAKWSYSNTGYIVLGLIVEAAAGDSLGAQLQQRVFAPLGLRGTTFDSSPRIRGRHAHGYLAIGKGPARDVSVFHPSFAWAAGAIVSTADDLARFYRALLQGRLLRADLLGAMKTTVAMGPPGESYGLGLWKTSSMGLSPTNKLACGSVWGHDGDFPGYLTEAFSTEDAKRQMVVLINSDSLRRPAQRALVRVADIAACA
jgi:D-alanyl-D-alanine carboxypeptidase